MVVVFFNQLTGVFPIKTSLKVPPPIEVTNEIIIMPKISSRLRIADVVPEIANETVPKISIISKKLNFIYFLIVGNTVVSNHV